MSSQSDLPLVFLYTDGRTAIEGATRFQKLVFLTQQETDLPSKYSYHADKFGPFSPELADDLEALRHKGYMDRDVETNAVGNEKYIYSLTPDGQNRASRLLIDANEWVFECIEGVKAEYNELPLQQLLKIVYRNYDDYATGTELDLDRLFDPDSQSQLLEEDREFLGGGPGAFKEKNPSAEEFFSTD